jgi:hypothetical protein
MTTSITVKAASVAVPFALLVALALTPRETTLAQASNTIGGKAYGAFVQTPLGSLAESPVATLDPASGIADASAANIGVAGVLTAQSLASLATGVVGENAASAQSSSTLQNVNILNGLITAKAVNGLASSASNGIAATSNGAGSEFVNLLVNGVAVGDSPAPNRQIALPNVGVVTLNEQVPRGDGRTSSGLTVNMIHLRLTDALTGAQTGEIIVGSARSDAAFRR